MRSPAAAAAALLSAAAVAADGAVVVERVVAMSRHSVRVPYSPPGTPHGGTADDFSAASANRNWHTSFADWGAPGEAYLTAHGKEAAAVRGRWWRGQYVPSVLSGGCGNPEVSVFVDGADGTKREEVTAEGFFSGLYPGCGINATRLTSDNASTFWLFNQGKASSNASDARCRGITEVESAGTLGGDPSRLGSLFSDRIDEINDLIACCKPSVCGGKSPCSLSDLPIKWNGAEFWQLYDGSFYTGAALAEWIEMMYLNGMNISDVAPALAELDQSGQPNKLSRLMDVLHAGQMRMVDTARAGAAFGSDLFMHMADSFERLSQGKTSDRMVFYFAHDVNVYFVKTALRLNWIPLSYGMGRSVPLGMLVFQLLRDTDSGVSYVRLAYQTQSYKQMRELSALTSANPPDDAYVSIPDCVSGPMGSCPTDDLVKRLRLAAIPECVRM